MKLILTHHHHQPSPSFIALIKQRIESLQDDLQIDEARVLVERRLEESPAFRVTAHLVTPGQDVVAEAVDHTLRAALGKLFGKLEAHINHLHPKRARRVPSPRKTVFRTRLTPAGAHD